MTRRQIWNDGEACEGDGAAVLDPSGQMAQGDHFTPCHPMFVYRANSVTWSASCPKGGGGKEGNVLHLLAQPPRMLPESITHIAWGAVGLQHNPEREIKPYAAQTSSVWPPTAFFNLCANSAACQNRG